MAECEEEIKSILLRVEESEKAGLKFNIKLRSWHPVHQFMTNRRKGGNNDNFLFLHSKITAKGYCSSHEIRRLLLGRKALTNLDSVLKSKDITLLTKGHIVKAMVFPVVMYGCERWTIKAER